MFKDHSKLGSFEDIVVTIRVKQVYSVDELLLELTMNTGMLATSVSVNIVGNLVPSALRETSGKHSAHPHKTVPQDSASLSLSGHSCELQSGNDAGLWP